MSTSDLELLPGTLDMLVLKTVALQPAHGFAIARRIQQVSGDVLRVEEGSLYPALYRMERRGWINWEWGTSENNRKAKFYKVTRAGRRQLESEAADWLRISDAVNRVMKMA